MALGKNLKKQKLITTEKEEAKPAKKKKVVKKKLIEEKPKPSKATKPAQKTVAKKASKKVATPKKKPVAKSKPIPKPKVDVKPVEEKVQPKVDTGLPIYIAKELHDLKTVLRERYQNDIAKISGIVVQFVVIEIGSELYAVDIDCVKEVVPTSNLSQTPNTPEHIQGIANVRGSTYVVFDLAKKFKLKEDFVSNYLLVLEQEGISAAVSLSHLPTTRKINGDSITSQLHMIENASLDVSYIKGLIQDRDDLIYYLDIIELLKNDKAIVVPDNLIESNK